MKRDYGTYGNNETNRKFINLRLFRYFRMFRNLSSFHNTEGWMKNQMRFLLLIVTLTLIGINLMAQEQVPRPPKARIAPKTTQIHGYTVVDDYAWLTDKSKTNPDVLSYLKAEDDYANAMMKSTEPFRNGLYDEMLARIKETDENVPYKMGNYFYYTRTEKGKQYPIYCRKKGDLKAAEEITLDMNKMAENQKFFSIGAYNVSDDGNLLAFSTDTSGFRQYKLHVKDLRDGKII